MIEEINKTINEAFDYPIRVNLPENLKEDKELINLVARDEILKDIVFKAEGYHVIIKEENDTKYNYINTCRTICSYIISIFC